MVKIKFILILVLAITSLTTIAQDFNPNFLLGIEAFGNDDYEKSFKYFKQGVLEKDKYCYGRLAALYLFGIEVDVDLQECRKWALKGYELGNSYSSLILGYSFLVEDGFDNMEALDKAIPFLIYAYHAEDRENEGDNGAYKNLCEIVGGYFAAKGNRNECLKWIEQGIQDFPEYNPIYGTASMLYWAYENYSKALEYAKIAEEGDDLRGSLVLGLCMINGDGMPTDKELGFKKIRKCALADICPEASYFLGSCYFYGHGTETNKTEAKRWFEHAAQLGNQDAIDILQEEY